MAELNWPLVLITAGVIIAVGTWFVRRDTKGHGGRKIGVFMFTRARGLLYLGAQSVHGLADLTKDGFGSFIERPESVVYLRSGRPWVEPKSDAHAAVLRSRAPVLLCRELDPVPLDIVRGQSAGYHGPAADLDDVRRLKNESERAVITEVTQSGGKQENNISLLIWTCIVSAVLCGGAWIGVVVLGVMQKGGA